MRRKEEGEPMHTKVVPQAVGDEGKELCACLLSVSWTVR